jgi:hypothetical protein
MKTKEPNMWYLKRGELWIHRSTVGFYLVPYAEALPEGDQTVSSTGGHVKKVNLDALESYKCNALRALWYAVIEAYLGIHTLLYLLMLRAKIIERKASFDEFLSRRLSD